MPWIELVDPANATGRLQSLYRAAIDRAGKVFHVIQAQSRQPRVLDASTRLYLRVMQSDSEPLSRAQREMIAVTVSRTNGCAY